MDAVHSYARGISSQNNRRPGGRLFLLIEWKLLVPALQSRTVISALVTIVFILAIFAGTVARSATQRRLVAALLIVNAMAVFKRCQPGFDLIKLRGAHDVLSALGKNMRDFRLGLLNPVGRLRVRGKCFCQRSRLLLLLGLHLFQ